MTAKVIPLVDQRAASRVPVIPVPAPIPVGTLNRCMPGTYRRVLTSYDSFIRYLSPACADAPRPLFRLPVSPVPPVLLMFGFSKVWIVAINRRVLF